MIVVSALVLSSCSTMLTGTASPANGIRQDVADSDLQIFGAGDDEVDQLVRNALADINTFWQQQFPAVFSGNLVPLEGGYYSVDPNDFNPDDYPEVVNTDRCLQDLVDHVAGNAFFCLAGSEGDVIAYDRTLLEQLMDDYGPFLPAMVMAHEFGHAIQARADIQADRTIVRETQADCFSGAWTGWVATDAAPHFNIRAPELDDLLRGLVEFRDPIGTDPDGQRSHGSYFDRVSAFQEGFDSGPTACRDDFDDDRIFTQIEFQSDDSTGDSDYETTADIADSSLTAFWAETLESADVDYSAPQLLGFDGNAPDCDGQEQDGELVFCPSDNTVSYDESDLTLRLHDEIGDYAMVMAIAIPYSQSVLQALGRPIDDGEALSSAVCLGGWFSSAFADGDIPFEDDSAATISPGDIDEAVMFLVEVATRAEVLPQAERTGFQLVDHFRRGFVVGPDDCGIVGLDD